MKNKIAKFLGKLSAEQWIKVALWLVVIAIAITTIVRLMSATGAGEKGIGAGVWMLLFVGMTAAAVRSRKERYLAMIFSGIAISAFLLILGNFYDVFSWGVIGLPLFAAAGIYGCTKTDGRTKSFLGFASGVIILFWMWMFYQAHPIQNVGFIRTYFFATDEAKVLFVLFLAMLLMTTMVWKKSKIAYAILAILFLSFLGNGIFDKIVGRFPDKLSPNQDTLQTLEKSWDTLLNKADDVLDGKGGAKNPPPAQDVVTRLDFIKDAYAKQVRLGKGEYTTSPSNGVVVSLEGGRNYRSAKKFIVQKEQVVVLFSNARQQIEVLRL